MTSRLTLLLLAVSAGLGACSMTQMPGEPVAHEVSVNGETFILRQLTESTWTANSSGLLKTLAGTSSSTAALRDAVEKTSGCKVTDSDFSRQGKQFDAQVDCGSKLSN